MKFSALPYEFSFARIRGLAWRAGRNFSRPGDHPCDALAAPTEDTPDIPAPASVRRSAARRQYPRASRPPLRHQAGEQCWSEADARSPIWSGDALGQRNPRTPHTTVALRSDAFLGKEAE